MIALILHLIFALTLANGEETYSNNNNQQAYQANREFLYNFQSQTLTGIPESISGSNQHAGLVVRAEISITFPADFTTTRTAYMQMRQIKAYKINGQIDNPRNWNAKIPRFSMDQKIDISDNLKQSLQMPVRFSYEDGLIKNVAMNKDEQTWISNLKRGALNMLQVNMKKENQIPDDDDEDDIENKPGEFKVRKPIENDGQILSTRKTDYYRVFEKTVAGNCEVAYTLNKQDPNLINNIYFTKTVNFENCTSVPRIRYNFRSSKKCMGAGQGQSQKFSDEEKLTKSSSIGLVEIYQNNGNDFSVQNVKLDAEYNFLPYEQHDIRITTYVKAWLELQKISIAPNQKQPSQEFFKMSPNDLEYDLRYEVEQELKFSQLRADQLVQTTKDEAVPEIDNLKIAQDLAQRLNSHLSQDSLMFGSDRLFLKLVRTMRHMNKQEIRKVFAKYSNWFYEISLADVVVNKNQKIQLAQPLVEMAPQLLASCGTRDCIQILIDFSKMNPQKRFKAAMAFASLVNTHVVSQEMIQDLTCFSETTQFEPLKQALNFATGSMIGSLCHLNEDLTATYQTDTETDFCPPALKLQYANMIISKGNQSRDIYSDLIFLKSLTNMGTEKSIEFFERVIRNENGRNYSLILRQEAVESMRKSADTFPRNVQRILMPVIKNDEEDIPLRIIAADVVVRNSNPSLNLLEQLVSISNDQREDRQLRQFIQSALKQAADQENPCQAVLAKNARSAVDQLNPIDNSGKIDSQLKRYSWHDLKNLFGLDLTFGLINANLPHHWPNRMFVDMDQNFMGLFEKSQIKLELIDHGMVQYFKDWIKKLKQQKTAVVPKGKVAEAAEAIRATGHKSSPKTHQSKTPFAYLSAKWKDQTVALIPFDKSHIEMIQSLFNNGVHSADQKSFMNLINLQWSGKEYNLNYHEALILSDITQKTVSAIGTHLRSVEELPLLAKLTGKIRINHVNMKKLNFSLDLNPSMLISKIMTMRSNTPFLDSGLRSIERAKFYLPINMSVEIDLDQNVKEMIKLKIQSPKVRREMLTYETRPITYVREYAKVFGPLPEPEEKTLQPTETKSGLKVANYKKCYGETMSSTRLCVKNFIHYDQAKFSWNHFFKMPFQVPSLINIYLEPSNVEKPINHNENFLIKLSKLDKNIDQGWNLTLQHAEKSVEVTVTPNENTYKASLILKNRINRTNEYQITVNSTDPKIFWSPNYQKSAIDRAEATVWFGESIGKNNPENFVQIRVRSEEVEQSSENTENDSQSRENIPQSEKRQKMQQSPLEKYYLSYSSKTNQRRKYTMAVQFQNIPLSIKNVTSKMWDLIRTKFFTQTFTDYTVKNAPNRVDVILETEEQSENANVTIETPRERSRIYDLPWPIRKMARHIQAVSDNSDYCRISPNELRTFKNHVLKKINFGTCPLILYHNGEQDFFIAAKFDPETKEYALSFHSSPNATYVAPNYQTDPSHIWVNNIGSVLIEVKPQFENNQIKFPTFTIKPQSGARHTVVQYDGQNIIIKADREQANNAIGLCVNQKEEAGNKHQVYYKKTNQEMTQSIDEFVNNYAIKNAGCKKAQLLPDESSQSEKSSEENSKEIQKPIHRTWMIENDDELLFSKRPIEKCPVGYEPRESIDNYPNQKNIDFVKINRYDERAAALAHRVLQNGESLDQNQLDLLPVARQVQESVHKLCEKVEKRKEEGRSGWPI